VFGCYRTVRISQPIPTEALVLEELGFLGIGQQELGYGVLETGAAFTHSSLVESEMNEEPLLGCFQMESRKR